MSNPEAVIEVQDLRVRYDRTDAVDGVSFQVRRGEVFALLGTNGAGKTTVLDVLEGFRSPTAGRVTVLGVDPMAQHDILAPRVGIVIQEAGFFDTLTVGQCLRAWSRFHRTPRSTDDLLAAVGLDHRRSVRCGKLSGGERRRLDLALALLGQPELVFLDEPTTGMDPEGRRETWRLIGDLVDHGTTVLLTTHYLAEAQEMADRVAIMHRGRIRVQGSLTDILHTADTSTVAFTVDSAQVDALPLIPQTRIDRRSGRCRVTITTQDPPAVLATVTAWAQDHRVLLGDLDLSRPTLEDVFLELVHPGASTPDERSAA
ncbi:ABC transporter ATP-binding protein [Nakamurella flavida]|uniref:ABC transporter ATP-binding protein n=1 Tax=Nakamurella flavida TaxID=363630 RepID=A0A938YEQ8_9ACTN|nr:ABC transporter ATP-binding protein [Nakamurella flavida]MBM9476316.1 ABC transporter ATP-binding protein [Nakamurella flavida]MDP9779584.1 ABC-2 type transport system ATP-binding protein [Nakamurella flavida]